MRIRFKKLHPAAKKLQKPKPGSVGWDGFPCEQGVIQPWSKVNVRLGFSTEFEEGYVALLADRSSMGNKCMTRFGGVIDPSYRGEWAAMIFNATDQPFYYGPDSAIIQVLFIQIEDLEDDEDWVEELSASERMHRGLGHENATEALAGCA